MKTYKNIIFDFGDIFINLNKNATMAALSKYGLTAPSMEMQKLAENYEQGLVSDIEFIQGIANEIPAASEKEITEAWNAIILDFPEERLLFIEKLAASKKHRLFLLSNTNALHIKKVIENMGIDRYYRFKACFEKFYLSHEIQLRKPNANCFKYVLDNNNLVASETLFIDDTAENTIAAAKLDIDVWNLIVGKEDITDLMLLSQD